MRRIVQIPYIISEDFFSLGQNLIEIKSLNTNNKEYVGQSEN